MSVPEKIAELEWIIGDELRISRKHVQGAKWESALEALDEAQKAFDSLKLLRNAGSEKNSAV